MKNFCCFLLFFIGSEVFSGNLEVIINREPGNSSAGTHMAPLLTAVSHVDGPILELGCGDFSTPILHAVCSGQKRPLLSAENNKQWMRNFLDLENQWHHFVFVPSLEQWACVGSGVEWGLVFVDHAPALQRVVDMKRLRKNTKVFVVHDVELPIPYGYEPFLSSFKYRYTYKRYRTQTSVVSDTIDVSQFFND